MRGRSGVTTPVRQDAGTRPDRPTDGGIAPTFADAGTDGPERPSGFQCASIAAIPS